LIIKRIKEGEYRVPHLFFEEETLKIGKLVLEIVEGRIPIEWDWECKFGDFEPTYVWYLNGKAVLELDIGEGDTFQIEFEPNTYDFTKYLDDASVCEAIREYERELV
jgi:hypothetical protein